MKLQIFKRTTLHALCTTSYALSTEVLLADLLLQAM